MAADQVYGPYGGKFKRDFYEGLYGALKTERTSFDSHWQELGAYLVPRRTRFSSSDRNRGDKRNQNIIDSTGRFAARTLQSGLHAGLTSPARPWFNLGTPDPDLAQFGPVKEWLHLVTQRMRTVFSSTNLYNTLPVVYGDIGVFGTGAVAIVEDGRDLFRAYAYPVGSYVLGMNSRGLVTTFMREYELTVRQIVEQFGGKDGQPAEQGQPIEWGHISTAVKALWDTGTYESAMPVLWVVAPNPERNAGRLGAKYFPWLSCHFERGDAPGSDGKKILRESGFRQFPIMAPRWDITGEDAYGTDCPGMTALGDVKQLQSMQKKKAQAVAKMIDPPLVGPSALRTQKTSLLPGDITYVDAREGMQGLRSIHEVAINLEHFSYDLNQTQGRIQRAFYEDLFLLLARSDDQRGGQPVTAREIEERHEEKLLALGPVLERTNDELLDPLIDRVYGLMDEQGLIPPAPEELQGVKLKVEYISIMAQAQKLVGVVGQDRFLQTVMPMLEFFPEVRRKVNVYQLIDNYGEMLGIDPRAIVATDEAKAAQTQDARMQQAAQAAEIAKTGAQAAKLSSETQIGGPGGDTALDRVLASGVGQ